MPGGGGKPICPPCEDNAPKPGRPNLIGYPQLVHTDKCALCKMPLMPLSSNNRSKLSSRQATQERLQCERCERVRYCGATCAHIHYLACHRFVCPIPDFSTDFNAEYIIRRGQDVTAIPIKCIDTTHMNGNAINAPVRTHALCYAWTTVPHTNFHNTNACKWCTDPVDPSASPTSHYTWFEALITRIRPATHATWPAEPQWAAYTAPMLIYNDCPQTLGPPMMTWPNLHASARLREDDPRSVAEAAAKNSGSSSSAQP